MAKMMGPRFKQCRRLGLNVCGHPKAMDRAERGTSRADKKLSPYGTQLNPKTEIKSLLWCTRKAVCKLCTQSRKIKRINRYCTCSAIRM